MLDERQLDFQTGCRHGSADGFAELGDDHLFDFTHRVDRIHQEERAKDKYRQDGDVS